MSLNTKLLISKEEIAQKVQELGKQISESYADNRPILAVCVLRGAVIFYSDLVRAIPDKDIIFDFITLSSYGDAMASSGNVKLINGLKEKATGKHVLVIEDIVDTGNTIDYIKTYFQDLEAFSVKIACLLDKPKNRKKEVSVDFSAFTLQGTPYVVGYGLDSAQKYRHLDAIYEVIG